MGACKIFIRCVGDDVAEISLEFMAVGLFIVKSTPQAVATLLTAKHK